MNHLLTSTTHWIDNCVNSNNAKEFANRSALATKSSSNEDGILRQKKDEGAAALKGFAGSLVLDGKEASSQDALNSQLFEAEAQFEQLSSVVTSVLEILLVAHEPSAGRKL